MPTNLCKNNQLVILLFGLLIATSFELHAGQLNIQLDNDVIFTSDGNYTNGFSLSWESKAASINPSHSSTNMSANTSESMPLFFQWQNLIRLPLPQSQSAWGTKLFQRMWTPYEIELSEPQPDDRPYAGLLEIESHTANYGVRFAQKNWLAIGMLGPKSGAEQVQKKIHSLTGSTPPQGWQHQIQDQVTFQLAHEVDLLLFRAAKHSSNYFANNQWEVSSYSHIALGNFNREASLGLLFRWGNSLDKTFGRLSSHLGHIGNFIEATPTSNFTAFSRVEVGYRFNDLSIEGQLPYESNVDTANEQAKISVGVNWTISQFAITWSLNSYSRAYSSDIESWHSYGSFTISYAM